MLDKGERSSAILSIVALIENINLKVPIANRRGEPFALALGKIDAMRSTLDVTDDLNYGEQTADLIRLLHGL